MDFALRLLTEDDLPAVEGLYAATAARLAERLGRAPAPGQATADFVGALAEPGRYQFGIWAAGGLVGLLDCKLSDEQEGLAQFGFVLLAEPFAEPAIAALAVRIATRWLVASWGVRRLNALVPAHLPEEIGFWEEQGFEFTGEQYRGALEGYHPRLLIMARDAERQVNQNS